MSETDTQLAQYLSVLRRRKWLVIAAVAIVAGSALVVSLVRTPVYQGRARLLLQRSQSPFETGISYDPNFVQTEIQVIKSEPVRSEVLKRIGVAPRVSAIVVGDTSVVEVRAESPQPAEAARITNTYMEAYIDYRRQQAVDTVLAVGQGLQQKIDALQAEINSLAEQINAIPPCTGANPPPGCAQRDSLQRDRDAKIAQQAPFKQRLDQLQVDSSLRTGGAQINARAAVPTEPVRPQPVRNAMLGIAVGLALGVGSAFLLDRLDDSIKTKEDLERFAPGLPMLGMIPRIAGWKKGESYLISEADPHSPAAEAYRALRTGITFAGVDREGALQIIQVTSPAVSEGKTTTCANLAIALATTGKRVVVVSTDLRRPRVHTFFGLPNEIGLTSVLLGEATLASALQKVPQHSRVMVLACGPVPPNPSELLVSQRTDQALKGLRDWADVILLDSPPMLPVTDAAVLAAKSDGTLLVVTAGTTTGKQLSRTVELLRQAGGSVIGAVLNSVSAQGAYGYMYYEYYSANGSRSSNGLTASGRKRRRKKGRRRLARSPG